jgi:8-oxo-dGTP pyrophosphatase MutT (NUDIX family)
MSVPREAARGRNDRMTIHDWPGRDALPPIQKWSASGSRELYRNRRITVEEVQVSTGTGAPFPHEVIRFASDSVAAVVHSPGHGVLMLYRHRFITDRTGLALPAGGVEHGEHPVDAAIREVFEETGCKLHEAALIGSAEVLPGVADKRFWLVSGTAEAGDHVPEPADAHESTALYWVPASELFSLMTAGLISAQPSMLALLYAERAGLLTELPTEEAPHGRTRPDMGRRADRIRPP